jgi:8-oxo-dGTP diphosphatase
MSYLQVGPQQRVKRLNISFDHEVTGAVLIDMRGRFLFQRRDDVPGILSPGKIGLFGGHRKTGETYLECIVREVHEEIGYFVHPERFKLLALYERLDPIHGKIRGELFVAHGVPTAKLRITEGTLLVAERTDLSALEPEITPSALVALQALSIDH